MRLNVTATNLNKALATNATQASSYDSLTNTLTRPTADGVHLFGLEMGECAGAMRIHPYGVGSDNNTFLMRLIGWNRLYISQEVFEWAWSILGEFTCTLSGALGAAGGLGTTARMVDTIALTSGTATTTSCEVVSPTGDVPGHIYLLPKGSQLIQFQFHRNSSATSANALYAIL